MKIYCLGGAGRICREAVLDLVRFSNCTRITVADFDEAEARRVVDWLDLTHTHPPSDGSVAGWEKLRAYTRNVGIPMSIGAQLLGRGKVRKTGVLIPEEAFRPSEVFAELKRRDILIHEQVTDVTDPEA